MVYEWVEIKGKPVWFNEHNDCNDKVIDGEGNTYYNIVGVPFLKHNYQKWYRPANVEFSAFEIQKVLWEKRGLGSCSLLLYKDENNVNCCKEVSRSNNSEWQSMCRGVKDSDAVALIGTHINYLNEFPIDVHTSFWRDWDLGNTNLKDICKLYD